MIYFSHLNVALQQILMLFSQRRHFTIMAEVDTTVHGEAERTAEEGAAIAAREEEEAARREATAFAEEAAAIAAREDEEADRQEAAQKQDQRRQELDDIEMLGDDGFGEEDLDQCGDDEALDIGSNGSTLSSIPSSATGLMNLICDLCQTCVRLPKQRVCKGCHPDFRAAGCNARKQKGGQLLAWNRIKIAGGQELRDFVMTFKTQSASMGQGSARPPFDFLGYHNEHLCANAVSNNVDKEWLTIGQFVQFVMTRNSIPRETAVEYWHRELASQPTSCVNAGKTQIFYQTRRFGRASETRAHQERLDSHHRPIRRPGSADFLMRLDWLGTDHMNPHELQRSVGFGSGGMADVNLTTFQRKSGVSGDNVEGQYNAEELEQQKKAEKEKNSKMK